MIASGAAGPIAGTDRRSNISALACTASTNPRLNPHRSQVR
jgi:hypothetical protein